jgi:[2Fe-2S] binding domain
VSDTGEIADLQDAFIYYAATSLQCGVCTLGMLLNAQELLTGGGVPSRAEIRAHLSGNCRRCRESASGGGGAGAPRADPPYGRVHQESIFTKHGGVRNTV